jgi:hypothetical protein
LTAEDPIAAENGNWIKLYRKVISNPVFQDARLFQIFVYCLCRANYKERKILFNGEEITLCPGEFISGRREASKDLKLKGIMWDRKLHVLEKLGILNRKVNNQFSVISIINWEAYQCTQTQDEQVNEHRMNNGRTTDEHRQERKERKEYIYTPDFEAFWKEYPKKAEKADAFKAWKRAESRPDIQTLLKILAAHKNSFDWKKDNGKYVPYPARWINRKRWEDDILEQPRSKLYG